MLKSCQIIKVIVSQGRSKRQKSNLSDLGFVWLVVESGKTGADERSHAGAIIIFSRLQIQASQMRETRAEAGPDREQTPTTASLSVISL